MADNDRQRIIEQLQSAVTTIENCPEIVPLVPEVRINIVYALPDAKTPADVAAVDGRITVVAGRPKAAGPVCFGASDHLARLILELRRFQPAFHSTLNFRWNEQIYKTVAHWAEKQQKIIGVIDRTKEPSEIIGQDRKSIPWKVKELLAATNGIVPEIAYETKGWGKEPLFILIGEEPKTIVARLIEIARLHTQLTD